MSNVIVQVRVPVMTPEKFAIETGLSERTTTRAATDKTSGVVVGLIKNGHLPALKLGKHIMVNMVMYTIECVEEGSVNPGLAGVSQIS